MDMDINFLLKTHQRQRVLVSLPPSMSSVKPLSGCGLLCSLCVEIKSPEATSSPKGSWGCLATSNLILNPGHYRGNIEILLYILC